MDFKKLSKDLVEVQLGNARMTDAKSGHVYGIVIDGEKIALVSDKKHRIPINTNASLAAMRIVEAAADAVKVKNTREARDAAGYSTLQAEIANEKVELNSDTKFTVVHKLQIQDTVNDTPIYKNECYKGYPEYVKAARKAATLPRVTEEQTALRNAAFNDASEELRKSGPKTGTVQSEATLLTMPVFMVSTK